MTRGGHFSKEMFRFLEDLRENNDRDWFRANKARYEEVVKGPALQFIVDFASRLKMVSPHFRADPRGNGGSLFRIYRDARFSKDKSPYKTHTGIQFRHEEGKDAHAPGFYLHLEPDGCFIGLGIWHPDGKTLRKIREALVDDPQGWEKATTGTEFRRFFRLSGDRLVRPPRGFDPDHPLIEDLKWKDHVASAPLSMKEVTRPGFIQTFAEHCQAGVPYIRFLCEAVGVPF